MNLTKLFYMQKVLDKRIEKEHPRQEGEDRFAKKSIALLVELGELANEQRTWKFWSKDKEPRQWELTQWQDEKGEWHTKSKNPLLEEYVDVLHFILSIGNEIDGEEYFYFEPMVQAEDNIVSQFVEVFKYAYLITEDNYCSELFTSFVHLGTMLGFTWEEIEQAYISKNEVNHERQNNNY